MMNPAEAPTTPLSPAYPLPPSTTDGGSVIWQPRAGDLLADHRLERILGRGGMGVVWLARHVTLNRPAAVKLLLDPQADGVARERFLREARACARLRHPHIVDVFHAGSEHGVPFLVLEYVPGGSLLDRLRTHSSGLAPAVSVRLLSEAALGLAEIHAAGILHRDLKPGNILIDEAGHAVLGDFGLAKFGGEALDLTGGRIVGTPRYLAPEIISGMMAGMPADVYALGATLYETLSGQAAIVGDSPFAIFENIRNHAIRPLVELCPTLPPPLLVVIDRLLAADPTMRPTAACAASELIALAKELAGAPSPYDPTTGTTNQPSHRAHWGWAAAAVMIGISVTAWMWYTRQPAIAAPGTAPKNLPFTVTVTATATAAPSVVVPADTIERSKAIAPAAVIATKSLTPTPASPVVSTPSPEPANPSLPPKSEKEDNNVVHTPEAMRELVATTRASATGIPLQAGVGVVASPTLAPGVPVARFKRTSPDPYEGDNFATGWRQVDDTPLHGVFASGLRVVAWGPQGVRVSRDQGSTWGPTIPVDGGEVLQAVFDGDRIWLRCADATLRELGGGPARNKAFDLGGVTGLLPAGAGLTAVEENAHATALLANGSLIARAPGQLIAGLEGGAVLLHENQLFWLGRNGRIPIGPSPELVLRAAAACGPASSVAFSAEGQRFETTGDTARALGRIPVKILCAGAGESPGGRSFLALLDDSNRGLVVGGLRLAPNQSLGGTEATADLPAGTRAVAGCGKDTRISLRIRLVAVGDSGTWVFRFR